jgi:hypothetical protein
MYIEIPKFYPLHGGVSHYYHFVMSVLIPLICDVVAYEKKNIHPTYIIDSNLGPMWRILFELPIDIKIKSYMRQNNEIKSQTITKTFPSFDIHPKDPYRKKDMNLISKGYAKRLTYSIYKTVHAWFLRWSIMEYPIYQTFDILVIERAMNPSYKTHPYAKPNSKNTYRMDVYQKMKQSGKETRSILNHAELVKCIEKIYSSYRVLNISLEYLPISTQFYLFHHARLVVAQHGAALSNMIFMNPLHKKTWIEIIDRDKYENENWFVDLSKCCKVHHYSFVTEEAHVHIDLDAFSTFVQPIQI